MAQTVADVWVGVLERVGVRQIFGLIGDSLNPLAVSVRHSSIESHSATTSPNSPTRT